MSDWSIKAIQDIIIEKEEWTKKNLYATDSDKCPAGLYHALMGEKSTNPDDPRGLRRMEVGSIVEYNQVKKLRSLGLLIEAQRRIYDEDSNVSGRHDGIVISPTECSSRAKELIERKKQIYTALTTLEKEGYKNLEQYISKEIDRDSFLSLQKESIDKKQDLYDEDFEINKELLVPNPENSLIVMEIKSIVEKGFDWRKKDGVPMDSHRKQIMFYLWKLREFYPNIQGRVIYVDTSYQDLLEFQVDLDMDVINDLQKFWKYINKSVEDKVPPPAAPSIVQNPKSGKWQVNYQAEWCKYHIKCTEDPNWLTKAIEEVKKLNAK